MPPDLYTFEVRGGGAFGIHPPGNPPVTHSGSMSVFHLTLTEEQADEVERAILDMGCRVKRMEMEGETEEQHDLRMERLGRGKEAEVYPTVACPGCYWFDPTIEGYCGYLAWPRETRLQSLDSHQAARDGLVNCPIQVGKEGTT